MELFIPIIFLCYYNQDQYSSSEPSMILYKLFPVQVIEDNKTRSLKNIPLSLGNIH